MSVGALTAYIVGFNDQQRMALSACTYASDIEHKLAFKVPTTIFHH